MDKSRRNLARALGVSGAGVSAWNKPLVLGIVLPAHAETTSCFGEYGGIVSGDDTACYRGNNDCMTIAVSQDGSLDIDLMQYGTTGNHNQRFIGSATLDGTLIDAIVLGTDDSCNEGESIEVIARLTPECSITGTVQRYLDGEPDDCSPAPFTILLGGTCPEPPQICPDS